MHTKPDLRVFLKWMIVGSGSVITDVMHSKGKLDWEVGERVSAMTISSATSKMRSRNT